MKAEVNPAEGPPSSWVNFLFQSYLKFLGKNPVLETDKKARITMQEQVPVGTPGPLGDLFFPSMPALLRLSTSRRQRSSEAHVGVIWNFKWHKNLKRCCYYVSLKLCLSPKAVSCWGVCISAHDGLFSWVSCFEGISSPVSGQLFFLLITGL